MSYDKIYKDNIVSGAAIRDGKGNRIDTMYLSKSQITNCILSAPNGVATYSGNTITVKEGLKVLIPNGRNADGTLNNIEYVVPSDVTSVEQTVFNGIFIVQRSSDGSAEVKGYYAPFVYIQEEAPNVTTYCFWFDIKNNKWFYHSDTTTEWIQIYIALLGSFTRGDTSITSLTPKLPFRAVDWSDIDSVVPTGTIVAFASTTTPTGFLYCNGANISRTAYAKLFNVIGTTYGTGDGSTTYALPNLSTAQFVTSSTASVYGNGKTLGLTNGTNNFGLRNKAGSGGNNLGFYPTSKDYGKQVGLTATGINSDNLLFGVTTDATKSGLTSKLSTISLRWYIKY